MNLLKILFSAILVSYTELVVLKILTSRVTSFDDHPLNLIRSKMDNLKARTELKLLRKSMRRPTIDIESFFDDATTLIQSNGN